jgi:adenylate kinase
MEEKGHSISKLLMLDVPDDEIVMRLLERGKTSGRPDDSNEELIRKRIEVFNEETTPVFDHYALTGRSVRIVGVGDKEEIFGRLCAEIDNL